MKEESVILACLRRHRRALLLWGGFTGLLFLVYGLYGLPPGPAVYTALLGALLALILGLTALPGERRRLLLLRAWRRQGGCPGELSEPEDAFEREYRAIIASVEAQLLETKEKASREAAEAARYYTLWSHQVKTPISAMRLLLQEDEPDRRALEQELFKTEQYVDMALQYQRLGSGSRDLVLRLCPLSDLVRQAVKRTATLFIHKKVALNLSPIDAQVISDEKWLVFVLEQLLTNAVKYTPEGGSVSIHLLPGEEMSLAVEDTGIGILPEDLPRVTEWGYTGRNGRLDKRSTGIGLSLCRQTLDMLGHSMRIESQVGKGTRVILDLSRHHFDIE